MANLPHNRQLDLIAEGFPILMNSADSLLAASKELGPQERPAAILRGHALEELAKILILIDVVRCPPKLRTQRIGPMMGWFYDHLARLIYVDVQRSRPTDVRELQTYVDYHRKSHYLEGFAGEYIMPNWTTWSREGLLYADIVALEDGDLIWHSPEAPVVSHSDLSAWELCSALQDLGVLTRSGLDIVSTTWSKTEFKDGEHWSTTKHLTREMLFALQKENLFTEAARDGQLRVLYDSWQMPMYWIDFRHLEVPLEDLRSEQETMLWNEIGR